MNSQLLTVLHDYWPVKEAEAFLGVDDMYAQVQGGTSAQAAAQAAATTIAQAVATAIASATAKVTTSGGLKVDIHAYLRNAFSMCISADS